MVVVGRVLLWTVVLVAPGGFLLVPVLALQGSEGGTLRERFSNLAARVRGSLQRYWTKS